MPDETQPDRSEEVVRDGYGGTSPAPAERGVTDSSDLDAVRQNAERRVVKAGRSSEPEPRTPIDDATNTVNNDGPAS